MTPEEIKALLESAVDPDKAPDALTKLKDGFDGMSAAMTALEAKTTEYEAKIAELRDSNTKLFLRQTLGVEEEEKEEEEELDFFDEMIERIVKQDGDN